MTERENWYKERFAAVERMRRANKKFRILTLALNFVFLPITLSFLIDVLMQFYHNECSLAWLLLIILTNCLVLHQLPGGAA